MKREPVGHERILVALDVPDIPSAIGLVQTLSKHVGGFKVGLELFSANGPRVVKELIEAGGSIFLDLKFHDIPNTVAAASREVAKLGVEMFNVHASGGKEMMHQAVLQAGEGADAVGFGRPLVIAVTVLTSLAEADWRSATGSSRSLADTVKGMALMAREAGLDGVVASPQEIDAIRETCGRDFLIVTPGIRSPGDRTDDQKRTATPREAVRRGADFLVIGRPIRAAADPVAAADAITKELE